MSNPPPMNPCPTSWQPLPPSKPSGIDGWSFYPTDAEGLRDAIRGSADFVSLSEVSRFASAAVQVLLAQEVRIRQLEVLENRIAELEEACRSQLTELQELRDADQARTERHELRALERREAEWRQSTAAP